MRLEAENSWYGHLRFGLESVDARSMATNVPGGMPACQAETLEPWASRSWSLHTL